MIDSLVWVVVTHGCLPSLAVHSMSSIQNKHHLCTQVCKCTYTHTLTNDAFHLLWPCCFPSQTSREASDRWAGLPGVICLQLIASHLLSGSQCSIEFNQYFLETVLSVQNANFNKMSPLPDGCSSAIMWMKHWDGNLINEITERLYDFSEATKPMTMERWLEYMFHCLLARDFSKLLQKEKYALIFFF